jgi:hypothetical protein
VSLNCKKSHKEDFGGKVMKIIVVVLIIILLLLIYLVFEYKYLEVTHFKINTGRGLGIRAAVISDYHNMDYGSEKMKNLIKANNCNCIFINGDLVVHDENMNIYSSDMIRWLSLLKLPTYFSLGNHELKFRIKYPEAYEKLLFELKKFGVTVLDNETLDCGDFVVSGYSGDLAHYSKFKKRYPLTLDEMKAAIPEVNTKKFHILLAHNPAYFEIYKKWGADLVLSGHLHGGIVRLPFIGGLLSPQTFFRRGYDAGLYQSGDSKMLVSRGLGVHTIPIRFNNRPELMIVDID